MKLKEQVLERIKDLGYLSSNQYLEQGLKQDFPINRRAVYDVAKGKDIAKRLELELKDYFLNLENEKQNG